MPSTVPTSHVVAVVGTVLVDPVPVDDVLADQAGHLRRRGQAVGAGGTEQLDPVGTGAGPLELGQQGREHGGVRHRPGQIGEYHHHLLTGPDQVPEGRTGVRYPQRVADGPGLVGQRGRRGGSTTTASSGTSTSSPWRP